MKTIELLLNKIGRKALYWFDFEWANRKYLELLYKMKTDKNLDLNNPITFNEKIQWLKIYDRNPLYTKMVDKYEVKKYVASKIGEKYVIPLLGVWDRFEVIDFDNLPLQFVLKTTHDSGGIFIVKDKNKTDFRPIREEINKHLKRNFFYGSREWPYKNVKPRIIAEKYMEQSGYCVPEDYKVYCMNGEPKYIVVFHNRFDESRNLSETVYDLDWKPQHISLDEHFAVSDRVDPKPECLDELLDIVRKLCEGMAQVRLDFIL